MGKATQDLRNEHDSILHSLQLLDDIIKSENKDPAFFNQFYDEFLYFLKIFADKCHHGKEENILFKELIKKGLPDEGGPVGAMLQEHTQGREYIAQMTTHLEQQQFGKLNDVAAQYRELMLRHIEKENGVLFVFADRLISEEEQDALFEQFEQHEEQVIGQGVHEKLHAMIEGWQKI